MLWSINTDSITFHIYSALNKLVGLPCFTGYIYSIRHRRNLQRGLGVLIGITQSYEGLSDLQYDNKGLGDLLVKVTDFWPQTWVYRYPFQEDNKPFTLFVLLKITVAIKPFFQFDNNGSRQTGFDESRQHFRSTWL